jgi:DnaJ-domain-containing protein 1
VRLKSLLILLLGGLVGGGLVEVCHRGASCENSPHLVDGPSPTDYAGRAREAEVKIAALEVDIRNLRARATPEVTHVPVSGGRVAETPSEAEAEAADKERLNAVRWKISAIEKFVPLNDEQRSRLTAKFAADTEAKKRDEPPSSESLEDILGAEQASFYRDQVQAAFKRAQDQEIEREVVWLSRQLSLSTAQEDAMREAMARVESQVRSAQGHGSGAGTPQERIQAMIRENQARRDLTNEELRKILSADQFQAYLKGETESAAADAEVFHDPAAQ